MIHRKFEELRKIRIHEGFLRKMKKRYDTILKKYEPLLESEMKPEVVQKFRDELNLWEA